MDDIIAGGWIGHRGNLNADGTYGPCSVLGGIQMDALFIDEGFGTLDKKSLENAMEILVNLTGSNKLVGIISHREELVENIPQQIKVTKTEKGSVIETISS